MLPAWLRSDSSRLRVVVFALGVAAVAAVAVVHVLYYFPRTVDDMYIFLRYAENLARGEGPVFNPGERVEGFSSPLWVGLLALGIAPGLDAVTWSKLLAVGSLVALFLGLYRLARERLEVSAAAALLACAFAALNSYLISWAMWGLETPLYLALMLWTAVYGGRVAAGSVRARRDGAALALVGGGLLLARPEAPLFAAAIALAVIVEPLRAGEIARRWRRVARPAAGAAAIFVAYLLFRRLYYGHWLPNTYDAKHQSGVNLGNLGPLWSQGVTPWEIALLWGGLGLAVVLAARRRTLVPLVLGLTTIGFAAAAFLDWMPNVRHLLPLYLVAPLGWAWLADRAARRRPRAATEDEGTDRLSQLRRRLPGTLVAAAATVVVLGAGLAIGRVDARYSPWEFQTHGDGREWLRPKTTAAWWDAWACLRRRPPPHVHEMDPFEMGMVTQLYRLLEADERPLGETWYVGRDIGRVGWLAPVRVFDTDGLFTRAVVESAEWQRDRTVSRKLVREALDRPVAMTDLLGSWHFAAQGERDVRRWYEPWEPGNWELLVPRGAVRPSAGEILARYERAVSRLPGWFYVMTLYGEAVGAAIERRLAIVREVLTYNERPVVAAVPGGLTGGGVVFDGFAELLGCAAEPEVVAAGEGVVVTCYFRPIHRRGQRYRVFLHLEGPGARYLGDHDPAGGFHPTDRWRPGEIVRDAWRVPIPPDAPGVSLRIHVGLYEGEHRAAASPRDRLDPTGRVPGPMIRIVRN